VLHSRTMITILLLLGTTMFAAENVPQWPQFRGPGGTGLAAEGSAPVEFGISKGLLWKTDVPAGHSSPSIWGDRIFLTAGDKQTKKLEILCLDRKTGKILWRREVMAEKIEKQNDIGSPATATPAVDGERVYVYFGSYGLVCFDHQGNRQWDIPLPVHDKGQGGGTSPILIGEALILSRDNNPEAYLLAMDRRTGKTLWKQPYAADKFPGAANTATPVLLKDEIVIHRSSEVVAYDRKTGARKWWVKIQSTGTGTPVAGPDAVYVPVWFAVGEPDLRVPFPEFAALLKERDKDGDGMLSKEEFPEKIQLAQRPEVNVKGANITLPGSVFFGGIDANHDGKVDKAEWDAFIANIAKMPEHGLLAIKSGGEGDVTGTGVLWREPRSVPEVPAPLYSKQRVYMVTNGGVVSCMDATSGKLLFRSRLGAGGAYFASPVMAGGNVYFTSGDGVISAIRDNDKFELVARNDLQEPIFATPAIVDGAVYVRTTGHLFAFGK
jgi:outer membrane protein assembly factor BamB